MARSVPDEELQMQARPEETLKTLCKAVFWVSSPFGILIFVLPIRGKGLEASAFQRLQATSDL